MHTLNFCGTLCLPAALDGHPTRGIDPVIEFERGFAVVMLGMETPFHLLYSSRPFLNNKPVHFNELQTKEDLINVKDAIVADCALDPDPRVDANFAQRDEAIKKIIKALFAKGHKRVVLWSNNGIGNEVTIEDDKEGVIRNNGVAHSVRKEGSVFSQYQKNLSGSYQNSSHDHIHIAPDDNGLFGSLVAALENHHTHAIRGLSLEEYRKMARENPQALPCMTVAVVDLQTDLSKPIKHFFYRAVDAHFPEDVPVIGFTRRTVLSHSINKGLKLDDKEVKKSFISKAKERYLGLSINDF